MKEHIDMKFINRVIRGLGTEEEERELQQLRKEDPALNMVIGELENNVRVIRKSKRPQPLPDLEEIEVGPTPLTKTWMAIAWKKSNEVQLKEQAENVIPMYVIGKGVGVAAVIALALGLGWLLLIPNAPSTEIAMAERQEITMVEKSNKSELLSQTQGAEVPAIEEGDCNLGGIINPTGFKTSAHFADSLATFIPQNGDQQVCKAYWEGWLNVRESRYAEAITAFEKVPLQPSSLMAQQAEQGLLIAYVLGKQDVKAIALSEQIASRKPDEVLFQPTYDFAKRLLKTKED